MLELARSLGTLAKTTGWKPRRSIVLCSWDGEEYGLKFDRVGGGERRRHYANAVAYVNVDAAVSGKNPRRWQPRFCAISCSKWRATCAIRRRTGRCGTR